MAEQQAEIPKKPLLEAGTLVDNYKVIRLVDRGGMGEVYLARDTRLGRKVALKIVLSGALGRDEALDRFLQEARITARFNHPHIVTIYGVGQHRDMPYVALEYLEGQPLSDRLAEEQPGFKEALRMALAVAEALAEAHRHNVLHRDLKPENVFLPKDGRLRVLDFGLAKLVARPSVGLAPPTEEAAADLDALASDEVYQTRVNAIRGTPAYMAPEQWAMNPGPSTDIWAFGLILHELFAGQHPVEGADLRGLYMFAVGPDPVPSLARTAPHLPDRLIALADRCLEKDPDKRPPAAEVAETVGRILAAEERRPHGAETPFRGLLPFDERHAHLFFGREDEVAAFIERLREEPVLPVVGPSGAGKSSFVQAGVVPRLREHGRWIVLRIRPGANPLHTLASRLLAGEGDSLWLPDFSGDATDPDRVIGARRSPAAATRGADGEADRVRAGRAQTVEAGRAEAVEAGRADTVEAGRVDADLGLADTVHLEKPSPEFDLSAGRADADERAEEEKHDTEEHDTVETGDLLSFRMKSENELGEELLEYPSRLSLWLSELAESENGRVLLFVDQLEELYTLVPDEPVRRAFMQALSTAADDRASPVRVVFTLRDDFLWRLAESAQVRETLGRVTVLRPPDPASLVETLVRPVDSVGYAFEDDDLPVEMVDTVRGEAAALPLLQFAAQQLWRNRDREKRVLTRTAYRDVGGVAGALARHADGTLEAMTAAQVRTARTILLRLVTPESTRRVKARSELLEGQGPEAEPVLEKLTGDRIVLVRKGQKEAELELVHESLIRNWDRLSRWLEESREERAFLDEVSQAATLWVNRGRVEQEVWHGEPLADALRQAARCGALPGHVREFLDAGRRREQRSARRKQALVAAGMGVLALIAVGALAVSWALSRKEQEATFERDRARKQRAEAVQQRTEAERQRNEALREGARAALARGELIEARAKLRGALEAKDTVLARALWWRITRNPLLWKKDLNAHLYTAAFSPDGRTVAVGSLDHAVYLLNVHTGQARVLRGHKDQVYIVAFSADGKKLASGTWSGEVRVWDLKTGRSSVFDGDRDGGWGLSFSPDGRFLASSGKAKTVRILDLESGRTRALLKGHAGQIFSVAFSPDGRFLASGSTDRTARIWDARTFEVRAVLKGHSMVVNRVAFGPRGRLLATAGSDKTVRIWEAGSGRLKTVLTGHRAAVVGPCFSPDGRLLASAGHDRVIRIWDVETSALKAVLRGHQSRVWQASFSPDGRLLASAGADRTVRIWRLGTVGPPGRFGPHQAPVMGISFGAGDRRVATSSYAPIVRLWDVGTGEVTGALKGHKGLVYDLSFSPDGKVLASAGDDRAVRIWDPRTHQPVHVLKGHTAPVHGLSFSGDGRLVATGGADRTVRVWEVRTGRPLAVLKGHKSTIIGVAFSPDGRRVAAGATDSVIRTWSVPSFRPMSVLQGHTGEVHSVQFSPDGRLLASASADHTVRIWTMATGKARVLATLPGRAYLVDFSPDGKKVAASCSDGIARIWDLPTGRRADIRGHRGEVNFVRFSRSGRYLASSGEDGTLRLWHAATGRPVWRAPLLRRRPAELFTHNGWIRLDRPDGPHAPIGSATSSGAPSSKAPAAARWRQAVETTARLASESESGRALCVATYRGTVEMWDTAADRRVGPAPDGRPVPGLSGILALESACVSLGAGIARVHGAKGEVRVLWKNVVAVAANPPDEILVAATDRVQAMDRTGRIRATYAVGPGVTAVARVAQWIAVGFKDGGIELHPAGVRAVRPTFFFEDTPASAVVRILPGPKGTLIAGFANGLFGLWSLKNGTRLEHARLHGPVIHLAVVGRKLYAASELGQHRVMDLGVFHVPYCELMRRVWRQVPVLWKEGVPVPAPPPPSHPCAADLRPPAAARSPASPFRSAPRRSTID